MVGSWRMSLWRSFLGGCWNFLFEPFFPRRTILRKERSSDDDASSKEMLGGGGGGVTISSLFRYF